MSTKFRAVICGYTILCKLAVAFNDLASEIPEQSRKLANVIAFKLHPQAKSQSGREFLGSVHEAGEPFSGPAEDLSSWLIVPRLYTTPRPKAQVAG